jgi:hypothetical protein
MPIRLCCDQAKRQLKVRRSLAIISTNRSGTTVGSANSTAAPSVDRFTTVQLQQAPPLEIYAGSSSSDLECLRLSSTIRRPPKNGYFAVVILRNGSTGSSVCKQIPLVEIKILSSDFWEAHGSIGRGCAARYLPGRGRHNVRESFGTLSVRASLVFEALVPGCTDVPVASHHMRRLYLVFPGFRFIFVTDQWGAAIGKRLSGVGKAMPVA